MLKTLAATLATLAFAGCATQLDPGAEKVRLVAANEKSSCESLGIVTSEQSLGPNKQGNAMNKALNEVARRGGNGLFLVSEIAHFDGVGFTGEALRCRG